MADSHSKRNTYEALVQSSLIDKPKQLGKDRVAHRRQMDQDER